jgi:hypothetical protein
MSDWYFKDGTKAITANYYTDKKKWVEETKLLEEKLCDMKYKIIKQTKLSNKKWVSTVWLGLDYSHDNSGLPLIFETMVFPKKGDWSDLDCERYSTEEEAIKGHENMVKKWSTK